MPVCGETMPSGVISQGTALGEHISGLLRSLGPASSKDNRAACTGAARRGAGHTRPPPACGAMPGPGLAPEPLTATVLGSVVPSRTPPPTPHPGRRGLACRVHARFHGRRHLGRGPFVEFLSPRQASVRGQGFLKHHCHVFAEKQGTGFSLSGNAELRFFALPHDILLPAWPQAVAFTPVGFRRSFTHSQCLGHPPGSWAQGAGARGTLSPVGIGRA